MATIMPGVERTLGLVTAEYQVNPSSPQLLSEFNQVFWKLYGSKAGLPPADLVVPFCPYTQLQIAEFRDLQGVTTGGVPDFALYVPEIFSTAPEGLALLGKAWPKMGISDFLEGKSKVRNEDQDGNTIKLSGWMRTERALTAPYLGTNQLQAERHVRNKDREGDSLNVYAVASQISRVLEDQYLDEFRTGIRVLSSRDQGQVLNAHFRPDGYYFIFWNMGPDDVDADVGVRSVEVARTLS